MDSNKLIIQLKNKGFRYIEININGISLLYNFTQEKEDVCIIVDNSRYTYFTGGQLESIKAQVEKKFKLSGYDMVETMFIILTNYPDRDKSIASYGINFWLLDITSNRIIIYENQPENYVNIKKDIEQILENKKVSKLQSNRFPLINFLIIAINIMVFIVMELTGSTEDINFMLNHGASYGKYIFENNEYYRLFTSTFIHFGSYHLINNMVILLIVGNRVEQIMGKFKFTMIYLVSGIGASLISSGYYYLNEELVVSAGASGAIFGIIGSLVIILFKNKERISFIMGIQFALLIVIILYNGFISTKIDTVAHLAGLIFGMIITSLIIRKSNM